MDKRKTIYVPVEVLEEAIRIIDGLLDQQAMRDDSWNERIANLKALI